MRPPWTAWRRSALAAALLLWACGAAAQHWPGARPVPPAVQAALGKVGEGDASALIRLAGTGDIDAQFYLADLMIVGGPAVPKDGAKGCATMAQLARTHAYAEAMHLVGECYEFGYGGEKDADKAIAAFHKAGDMGFPKSRCAEGNVLFALRRDEARAFALCLEGATAGDPDAETDVGNYYLMGQHVAKDVVAARGWYEKAVARNQQPNAAYVLGQIYWNGDGVPADIDKAAGYWRIAYAAGRVDAAFQMGNWAWLHAQRGDKVWDPDGLQAAHDWYAKATTSPNPEISKQAVERRDLAAQLKGVMLRTQPVK